MKYYINKALRSIPRKIDCISNHVSRYYKKLEGKLLSLIYSEITVGASDVDRLLTKKYYKKPAQTPEEELERAQELALDARKHHCFKELSTVVSQYEHEYGPTIVGQAFEVDTQVVIDPSITDPRKITLKDLKFSSKYAN